MYLPALFRVVVRPRIPACMLCAKERSREGLIQADTAVIREQEIIDNPLASTMTVTYWWLVE
jgi:hypothetical protein